MNEIPDEGIPEPDGYYGDGRYGPTPEEIAQLTEHPHRLFMADVVRPFAEKLTRYMKWIYGAYMLP
jgi:hypothetical protein